MPHALQFSHKLESSSDTLTSDQASNDAGLSRHVIARMNEEQGLEHLPYLSSLVT